MRRLTPMLATILLVPSALLAGPEPSPGALSLVNEAGVASYVRIEDAPGLRPEVFTIDLTFRPTGPGVGRTEGGSGAVLFGRTREGLTGNFIYSWYLTYRPTSSTLFCGVSQNGTSAGAVVEGVGLVCPDRENRASMTFDGAQVSLYLNGELVGSTPTVFESPWYGADDLLLGAANFGAGFLRRFDGTMDDVTFWSSAKSAAEVLEGFAPMGDEADLIGWWDFDGDSLADRTGNGFDGVAFESVGFVDEVAEANPCPVDLDRSGVVDLADLNLVLASFGTAACGDITGDGATNLADLNALLGEFGKVCE